MNLSLPARPLQPARSAGTPDGPSRTPHLQHDPDDGACHTLPSSCSCEEQTKAPLTEKEPARSPLVSAGNKAGLAKTTQERHEGKEVPCHPEKDTVHSLGKSPEKMSYWNGACP